MKAGVCIGFLQEQSFFLWDKVLAVVLVTVQGDCNSPLVTGISLHVLHFSFGWVSSIFVKMASKLLFWFSEERYFLNSCFLLWYSHFEQSTPERDSFAIRVAITNIFFWKFAISVSFVIPVRQHAIQQEKRKQTMGFLCILLLQLFFLTTQSSKAVRTLPKFGLSIAVAHLCSMLLSSLWCALNFTVILDCSEFYLVKFWISARLRFHSCTWRPLPVFSKPSLWVFFLMLCFPLPLHLLFTFMVCLMSIAPHPFIILYLKPVSDFSTSVH